MKDILLKEIGEVIDASNGKTLKENEGIKFLGLEEDESKVNLILEIEDITPDNQSKISRQIAKIVKLDHGFNGVKITYEQKIFKDPNRHYIGIASGKGGVGKSTVTANIAIALKSLGKKVAIIDADIYGSSIPKIFDIPKQDLKQNAEGKILPIESRGVEIVSAEFFTDENKPLLWRGPMLGRLLKHFFGDVQWDDAEYILVDLPPGTGDVALDIQTLMPSMDFFLVTTPHPTAGHVAAKAGFAAESLKHDILGVIENMSYYLNPCTGMEDYIFGQGGGLDVANRLKTELIAKLPIGMPEQHHTIYSGTDENGLLYLALANKILKMYR